MTILELARWKSNVTGWPVVLVLAWFWVRVVQVVLLNWMCWFGEWMIRFSRRAKDKV